MSKLTVTIPDDLHQQIRDELERQGITTSQFIEQAVTTFFQKPKGVSNMATRTLAFQVSEELLQRIKTFLARYEQIYHRKLSQKEFVIHLIEAELDEADEEFEVAEAAKTEQADEESKADEPWDEDATDTDDASDENDPAEKNEALQDEGKPDSDSGTSDQPEEDADADTDSDEPDDTEMEVDTY